jgi:hypothetical protein
MNLSYRQEKIQAKRKQTPWRDFVMDFASRYPFAFYKNNNLISKYHPNNWRVQQIVTSLVYETKRNDGYNQSSISVTNDFFVNLEDLLFSQVHEWLKQFPNCENSDYVDIVFGSKNVYLSSCVLESENVAYSVQVKNKSANVYNSMLVYDACNNIFSSRSIVKSYNIFYSSTIQNSSDLWFCVNMIGCRECLLCEWLENKTYCIRNRQYSKEEYELQKKYLLSQKDKFISTYNDILQRRWMNTWDTITGASNIMCFDIEQWYYNYAVKDGRNVCFSGDGNTMAHIMDAFSTGCLQCNNLYAVMGVGYNANHIYCCIETAVNVSNCYYCYYLESSSFCFWCVWLKNKSYCILNKQYTKEERYAKVDEIFQKMEEDWQLWEFFPATMNPFYFNDTAAYLIDSSFTKEEVTAKWSLWRDEPIRVDIPEWAKVVKTSELGNYEWYRPFRPLGTSPTRGDDTAGR